MKNFLNYLMVTVKGICMGAADVIPGVSGGTIAFMTGIYEELIGSINSIDGTAVKLFFTGKFRQFWKHINGNFLLSVAIGILFSVFSLAKLMQYLLSTHPIQTWAFFFGLIIASSILILKDIKGWKIADGLILLGGIVLGVVICTLSPTQTPDGLWFIFICGAIAICAMILPGISGSFILLILGKYKYIMETISGLIDGLNGNGTLFWNSALILAVFAIGALIGILAFSKFLHWLLARYHRSTLLVLAGFIIGSLVKVWPWSNKGDIILSQFASTIGETDMADHLLEMTSIYWPQIDLHIGGAIGFALLGFAIVGGIKLASMIIEKKRQKTLPIK